MIALKYVFIVFSKTKNYHFHTSIIESSFFIIFCIDKMTALKYQFKGCFSVSIKFLKNF